MRPRPRLTDWLVALSLSNLTFLRSWGDLLGLQKRSLYWLNAPPGPAHYIALLLDVAVLGAAFYGLMGGLRKRARWAILLLPVAGLLVTFSLVNSLHSVIATGGSSPVLFFLFDHAKPIGAVLVLALLVALWVWGTRVLRPVYRILLVLTPFLASNVGQSLYRVATYQPNTTPNGPLAARLAAKPAASPRVVWVIFDEWDPELTFEERPARIHLPEIDRLRGEVFDASQALRPGENTDVSMPALIMGVEVESEHPTGPSELMVRTKGSGGEVEWSKQDTVFREARRMGFNTGVAAWALPYCRVLNADLSECSWWSGTAPQNNMGKTVPEMLVRYPRSLYETPWRSPFGLPLSALWHIQVYEHVWADSQRLLRDHSLGLTLLHLPVPHNPFFFNAATGHYDLGATPVIGLLQQTPQAYLDALVLVDRTIGELRRSMERDGTWETTSLIFTADHPLRPREQLDGKPMSRRVPFLVKVAGASQGLEYATPFSSLLTRKLIVALLGGEVKSEAELPGWLDRHRGEFPTQ